MLAQKTVRVGKTDYTLQEFTASDGLFWTITLAQLASGALLGIDDFPADGSLESQNINIGRALRGVATHMPAAEFVRLCKRLYADGVVAPEYDEDLFDQAFSGSEGLEHAFKLLGHIVAFNFSTHLPTLKKSLLALTGLSWPDSTASESA